MRCGDGYSAGATVIESGDPAVVRKSGWSGQLRWSATLAAMLLVATPSPLLAASPALPRVENGRILLPAPAPRAVSCSHRTFADPTPELARLLFDLVEGGRVLPKNPNLDSAGPQLFAAWDGGSSLFLRASVESDTVAFTLEFPEGKDGEDDASGALLAPGLVSALEAQLEWRPFLVHDVKPIRRLDFLNWQGRRFACRDGDILARLTEAFRIAPSSPSACPYWDHLRLETDAGVLFCSLVADGCYGSLLLAPPSPELERAWKRGGRVFERAMASNCTEYAVGAEAYEIFNRLARSHYTSLEFGHPLYVPLDLASSLLDWLSEGITSALRRFQASGDTGIGVTKSD